MPPSVLHLLHLLLLSLLSSTDSLPPPRISFSLNSADRPLVFFSPPDVHQTTTLLLSDDDSTLFVGAQDALLSLDVSQRDVISLRRKVQWGPSDKEIQDCERKGKRPTVDCPNLVHVLQPLNSSHLYACGSFAFSPHDVVIEAQSFSIVQRGVAKGRCPFSPFQRSSALTVDGELFVSTTTDFKGVQPQISRHFSKDGRPDVSQDPSVTLEEPTFVSSSSDPSDRKLYFFFTEVGKEFSFLNKLRIARVARVCKDDVGGQRTLQKKWTSFVKAPLLCPSAKQLPFNLLEDMFTLQPPEGSDATDTLFYGIFTSQWSSGPESAVCVFKLQDVKTAFSGSYRTFNTETHQWSPLLGKHSYLGKCGLANASDPELAEVKKSFLTSSSVRPDGGSPVIVSSGVRYSRVVAMRTEAANGKQFTVLFLVTESGFLHKVALFDQGAHVIEEIQVFTQPQSVRSILLSSSKGVLYIGTSDGVTAVPVANCAVYRSCSQCLLARDPLCGWSQTSRTCTRLDGSQDITQVLEDGDVEEKCRGQTRSSEDTDVLVRVNQAVRLPCPKPSNLASLTWTSPQINHRTEKFFIQSADGTLSFFAGADTFGSYRCEAQEGGYTEVVTTYNVRPVAPPRSLNPKTTLHNQHPPTDKDEPYEDIPTETPPPTPPPADPETRHDTVTGDGDKSTTDLTDDTEDFGPETTYMYLPDDVLTSRNEPPVMKELDEAQKTKIKEKSYHGELVAVSLLLALCICVLIVGGVHMWNQKRTGLKLRPLDSPANSNSSKTDQSMETVPSLSSPLEPEVKVVD